MARTHSSYTASPTRWRSPQRSPARRQTSEDGSQYEMDLDALGLNSTFESTELEEQNRPRVDVVDTSDIDGPEDFTMNMTYWMTADLSSTRQIRSRKDAHAHVTELRGNTRVDTDRVQDTATEGDKAVIEESSRDREAVPDFNSASPTMRANGTADGRSSSKAPSEASMENEEKVRSYLSGLPDTEIGSDALTSTPLRVPKQNMLQVPSPVAPKARSLQATVEDYDTPRKPTQQTVIHHPIRDVPEDVSTEQNALLKQVAELQSQLEQREVANKTRITELETLLSFARSELEGARSASYKQKEQIDALKEENHRQKHKLEDLRATMENRLKAREDELDAKMQEFGEELRLQNLAKLQNQREDFERQLGALKEAKRSVDEEVNSRGKLLEQAKSNLSQLRKSHEEELSGMKKSDSGEQRQKEDDASKERAKLQESLCALQSRADALQLGLEKATTDARSAREEAERNAVQHASAQKLSDTQGSRILDLESQLRSLQTQLDSAHADVAAKESYLSSVADLQANVQTSRSQLESLRAEVAEKNQQLLRMVDLESRLNSVQKQLDAARADAAAKDQQVLRHIEEQERYEQRVNTAQGRIEGLEGTVSAVRQQLADAHRDLAKTRTDTERFKRDLDEAADQLQDARVEADRRVADVEKKLSKVKELKSEAEARFKKLQSQHEDLVEEHEAKLEDMREKAEDAVRKAGAILDQERSEKKRLVKELKRATQELEQLRAEVARKAAEENVSDDGDSSSFSISSSQVNAKDAEIESLRALVRKQASTLKSLKSETSTLRQKNAHLLNLGTESATAATAISTLQSELSSLREENEKLKAEAITREEDFEAVNKALDERLASMLSKVLKQRAKTVVGKRDGQWVESIGKVRDEREFMGKVLMREWGRHEVGAAREEEGERQKYRYQFVRRD